MFIHIFHELNGPIHFVPSKSILKFVSKAFLSDSRSHCHISVLYFAFCNSYIAQGAESKNMTVTCSRGEAEPFQETAIKYYEMNCQIQLMVRWMLQISSSRKTTCSNVYMPKWKQAGKIYWWIRKVAETTATQ